MAGCQGWQWWPEESWRQTIWPLLAWSLFFPAATFWDVPKGLQWLVAGLLSMLTAMVAMPGGEGWEDTLPLHRVWLPAVAASCLLNSYSLEQLSKGGGHRWSLLVALAGLGGPMALAAATYGSLAQWTLALIVATSVITAFGIGSDRNSGPWAAAIPASVAATGIIAAGRFYSYETHPAWVYLIMLFSPTLVTLADAVVRRKSTPTRVLVSGLVCSAIVAACIWRLLLT
jgi:hypothetical protein